MDFLWKKCKQFGLPMLVVSLAFVTNVVGMNVVSLDRETSKTRPSTAGHDDTTVNQSTTRRTSDDRSLDNNTGRLSRPSTAPSPTTSHQDNDAADERKIRSLADSVRNDRSLNTEEARIEAAIKQALAMQDAARKNPDNREISTRDIRKTKMNRGDADALDVGGVREGNVPSGLKKKSQA